MHDFQVVSGEGWGFRTEDLRQLLDLYPPFDVSNLEALRDEYDFSFPSERNLTTNREKGNAVRGEISRADAVLGLQIIYEDVVEELKEAIDFEGHPNCLSFLAAKTSEADEFRKAANRIIGAIEAHYRGEASPIANVLTGYALQTGNLTARPVEVRDHVEPYPCTLVENLKRYRRIDFFYNHLASIRQTLELPDAIVPLDPLPPAVNAIPVVGFVEPKEW